MEANARKAFQMQIIFNIFPRISLHCKLVLVQYWEYEYGLLFRRYWLGGRKVRELTKVMATVLSWYLNKMSYFSYKEILERRTELFKLINGDVFYSFLLLNFFESKTWCNCSIIAEDIHTQLSSKVVLG